MQFLRFGKRLALGEPHATLIAKALEEPLALAHGGRFDRRSRGGRLALCGFLSCRFIFGLVLFGRAFGFRCNFGSDFDGRRSCAGLSRVPLTKILGTLALKEVEE